MVTFWSRASLPAWTAASAAIMIEILRVLAEGTATSPRRLAVAPLARSRRYQLTSNSALSLSSLRRFTKTRIGGPLSSVSHHTTTLRLTDARAHGSEPGRAPSPLLHHPTIVPAVHQGSVPDA